MIEIICHAQSLDKATAGLTHALRDDLPLLKAQVNHRLAQLWEINSNHGKSWMISRVEQHKGQQELVICCYQGCDLKRIAPIIDESAKQQGFNAIRFHTQRKGLNRLIVDLGFAPYETVYKKTLTQEMT